MSVKSFGGVLQGAEVRTLSAVEDSFAKIRSRMQWQWMQLQWKRVVTMSAEATDVLIALITPAALIAFVFGLWRLTTDLDWTEEFPIAKGFFSHWQVWIALAIGLKMGGSMLAARMVPAKEAQPVTQPVTKTEPRA